MSRGTAAAYSATGSAWERGPARIYNRLAEIVVAALPVDRVVAYASSPMEPEHGSRRHRMRSTMELGQAHYLSRAI